MNRQLSHYTTKFEERKFPIVLICDGVAGSANIGGLFRLADAFNLEKIILCGPKIDMTRHRILKTARATLQKTAFENGENTIETCSFYTRRGYSLVALEITNNSLPLESFSYNGFSKIALIIGNENTGIDDEVLEMAGTHLHIQMFGKNSSMNVAQATGIALYEITKSLSPI